MAIHEQARRATFRIVREDTHIGMGFHVGGGMLITCQHVMDQANSEFGLIRLYHDDECVAELGREPDHAPATPDGADVCFFHVASLEKHPFVVLSPALSPKGCAAFSYVAIPGYEIAPTLIELVVGPGTTTGTILTWEAGDFALAEGASGAPVIDRTSGRVLGVISNKEQNPDVRRGFMVPVAKIKHEKLTRFRKQMRGDSLSAWLALAGTEASGPAKRAFIEIARRGDTHALSYIEPLDALKTVKENLTASSPSPMVVDGPAGRGKSRLMRHIAEWALEHFAVVYLPIGSEYQTHREEIALGCIIAQITSYFPSLRDHALASVQELRKATSAAWSLVHETNIPFLFIIDGIDEAEPGWNFDACLFPFDASETPILASVRTGHASRLDTAFRHYKFVATLSLEKLSLKEIAKAPELIKAAVTIDEEFYVNVGEGDPLILSLIAETGWSSPVARAPEHTSLIENVVKHWASQLVDMGRELGIQISVRDVILFLTCVAHSEFTLRRDDLRDLLAFVSPHFSDPICELLENSRLVFVTDDNRLGLTYNRIPESIESIMGSSREYWMTIERICKWGTQCISANALPNSEYLKKQHALLVADLVHGQDTEFPERHICGVFSQTWLRRWRSDPLGIRGSLHYLDNIVSCIAESIKEITSAQERFLGYIRCLLILSRLRAGRVPFNRSIIKAMVSANIISLNEVTARIAIIDDAMERALAYVDVAILPCLDIEASGFLHFAEEATAYLARQAGDVLCDLGRANLFIKMGRQDEAICLARQAALNFQESPPDFAERTNFRLFFQSCCASFVRYPEVQTALFSDAHKGNLVTVDEKITSLVSSHRDEFLRPSIPSILQLTRQGLVESFRAVVADGSIEPYKDLFRSLLETDFDEAQTEHLVCAHVHAMLATVTSGSCANKQLAAAEDHAKLITPNHFSNETLGFVASVAASEPARQRILNETLERIATDEEWFSNCTLCSLVTFPRISKPAAQALRERMLDPTLKHRAIQGLQSSLGRIFSRDEQVLDRLCAMAVEEGSSLDLAELIPHLVGYPRRLEKTVETVLNDTSLEYVYMNLIERLRARNYICHRRKDRSPRNLRKFRLRETYESALVSEIRRGFISQHSLADFIGQIDEHDLAVPIIFKLADHFHSQPDLDSQIALAVAIIKSKSIDNSLAGYFHTSANSIRTFVDSAPGFGIERHVAVEAVADQFRNKPDLFGEVLEQMNQETQDDLTFIRVAGALIRAMRQPEDLPSDSVSTLDRRISSLEVETVREGFQELCHILRARPVDFDMILGKIGESYEDFVSLGATRFLDLLRSCSELSQTHSILGWAYDHLGASTKQIIEALTDAVGTSLDGLDADCVLPLAEGFQDQGFDVTDLVHSIARNGQVSFDNVPCFLRTLHGTSRFEIAVQQQLMPLAECGLDAHFPALADVIEEIRSSKWLI